MYHEPTTFQSFVRISVPVRRYLGTMMAVALSALLLLGEAAAQRPPAVVTGRVTDNKGEALVGVNIRLKNGTAATRTDTAGNFKISVPDTQGTLVFTYLGFSATEVPIRGRSTVSATLVPDITGLNEVVVLGYGSSAKKDVTGSVSQVRVEDLQKAPVLSFDQALAGRVAGVQVSSNDGQPGAEGINIVVRGANSLSQSNSPLYVIDGFPMEDPENMSLNPEDIKTINILKDASATAIYGARGANGVVVIETKHGQAGAAPAITATASFGFQDVTKRMELMSPYDFVRYQFERDDQTTTDAYLSNGLTLEDYKRTSGINWQDRLFRRAPMQVYNIAVRGGNDKTKYAVSGSVSDQEGVLINSGQNRYQGRFVLDQAVGRKVNMGINVNYSRFSNNGQIAAAANAGNGASSYLLYSVWGSRPVSGKSLDPATDDLGDELIDEDIDQTMDYRVNPIISAENEIRKSISNNLIANAFIAIDVIPDLKLRISGGVENLIRRNTSFYNSLTSRGTPLFPNNTRGQFGSVNYAERSSWLNENTLTWTKRINRYNRVEVLGGFTMQGTKAAGYGFLSQNVPNESLGVAGLEQGIPGSTSSSASENKLSSFLGRVNYSYRSRYLFTVSFRADGSSKFSPENRWAYFPSAAFAWRLKEEGFMKSAEFISEAKFRTSYGVTGNNRVNDFATLPALTSPVGASYSFNNGSPSTGVIQSSLGNSRLKWENTTQIDVGLDLGFLNNRIMFNADIYRKTTSDLLLNANLPTTTGFSNVFKNIGEVRNEGLELTLTTVNVRSKSFSWNSDINISFNRNKVMGLAENQDNLLSTIGWENSFNTVPLYMASLNGPAAMFFGYLSDGLYQVDDFDKSASGVYSLKLSEPTNGMARYRVQPGDIRYKDINLDGVVDEKDRVVIGRVLPKHSGGFNNNFSYKRFDLNIFFQWSYGNQIYNANRMMFEGNVNNKANLNQYASYNDRWTTDNQDSKMFRTGGYGPSGYYSDYYLEDGSFLRLKTVSLAYSLPVRLLGPTFVKSLSATVSAQNIYTWTKYSGMDPEVSVRNSALTPGFDYSAYPRARTLVFGIRAGF
ncbi:SusC/RagA family TonB-linked outer membrane protein [Chitinophaga sp. 22620]|uniref:SusC/RagA family TonB-linked outer membrane protein n=1 Tax=Chitinophaga sp. 22620 TaxID=3453952 RepID=UPI003F826F30